MSAIQPPFEQLPEPFRNTPEKRAAITALSRLGIRVERSNGNINLRGITVSEIMGNLGALDGKGGENLEIYKGMYFQALARPACGIQNIPWKPYDVLSGFYTFADIAAMQRLCGKPAKIGRFFSAVCRGSIATASQIVFCYQYGQYQQSQRTVRIWPEGIPGNLIIQIQSFLEGTGKHPNEALARLNEHFGDFWQGADALVRTASGLAVSLPGTLLQAARRAAPR
ncbi:MAG: hypothetical protein M3O22_07255 [Pseudomonadota bacterium]|nr:hypothetical protein [Pseudomonadota bacterium]